MPEHRTCCTGAAHAYIEARPGDRGSINHRLTRLFRTGPDTERTPARCSAQSSPHITYGFKPAQRNPLQSPPHNIENMELQHALNIRFRTGRGAQNITPALSIPRMPAAARGGASQMRTTVRAARPRGLTAEAEPTHCAALHPSRTRGASGGGGGGRLADERSRVGLSATSRSGAL